MKQKTFLLTFLCVITAVILASCGAGQSATPIAAQTQDQTPPKPNLTSTPLPSITPRPTSTPTQSLEQVQSEAAKMAARDYFSKLKDGDFEKAADLVSTFSRSAFNIFATDITASLQQSGEQWSELKVLDTTRIDDQTQLVHVTYTQTKDGESQTLDEQWPFRLENNGWRYNWKNLIDFHPLYLTEQTMYQVTILPTQIDRYPDGFGLHLIIQNRTKELVVFGYKGETLSTFYFGDQAVDGEAVKVVSNPYSTIPDVILEVKGDFNAYPDAVDLRTWKGYKAIPWYHFDLAEGNK